MNKKIKPEIGFEEEVSYHHKGPETPTFLGMKLLKSGFFYKRSVLLSEAYFEHCYKTGDSLFAVNLIEGDTKSQRRLSFVLTGEEKKEMEAFLAANKVPFELELVIRLGVHANEQ